MVLPSKQGVFLFAFVCNVPDVENSMPKRTEKQRAVQPLPFPVYFWTTTCLALAGLAVTGYLSVSHYRVYTDAAYESFCAISRSINCDTVSQSSYSVFLGLPVPFWGVIGYAFFLLLLAFARGPRAEKRRVWPLLSCVALGFSLYSIVLAMISTWWIESFCILCIVLYGINFLLLYFTWLTRKRFDPDSFFRALQQDLRYGKENRKTVGAVAVAFLACVGLTWSFFPVYWSFEPPAIRTELPHGVTDDGHPWIGAEDAELVITEFTDYLCFQCNKMHYYLRNLMVRYPGKLKIIHRHFPMDQQVNPLLQQPVHVGSGMLALFALYAASQDKFWQMSDHLFATARFTGSVRVAALAETVGLDPTGLKDAMNDPVLWKKLRADMTDGFKLGVSGTPTFVVNGRLFEGYLPPEIISRIIN
jgi:protein-disulfide isomerase/uncharacterized membrane protein